MKRLLPPLAFIIAITAMAALHVYVPVRVLITSPYRWLGVIPIVLGLFTAKWGARMFASVGTNIMTFGEPDKLVTHGFYKYTRNPMYLGFVLALLGVVVTLGSVSSVGPLLLFLVLVDRWYIPFEERQLELTFGSEYLAYKGRVRRWL